MISPESWRPADGLQLEPYAVNAAKELSRNVAVTAGPGAGKTEMLAQRADFLLRTGRCLFPQRILAISFKVDAAHNLRERVRRRCGPQLASRFDSHTFNAFAKRLIDKFLPALTGEDALDADYTIGPNRISRKVITFDDQVPLALQILRTCPVALMAVRQTYSHVFLDEFQDCTSSQYSLIATAFKGTDIQLTAVGDIKQRIMGFVPGALEGIFAKLGGDFHALPLNLYQNFRSKPQLRRMQNRMVKVLELSAAVDDDSIQGDEGEIRVAQFADSSEEAASIAEVVERWINEEQIPHSEIAILISRNPELYAEQLMLELQARGIPYRNEQQLQDLSAEPVARLILDFLTVVLSDREPDAYERLMTAVAFPHVDDNARLHSKWQRFIEEKRRAALTAGVPDAGCLQLLVREFLTEVGPDSLRSLSHAYEQGTFLTDKIRDTAEHITKLWNESGSLIKALGRFSEDRAVRILTIHKSKGLEFDSVIILGVENETFWGKIADQRPAFFVGISRAKRRLLLTHVHNRPRPDGAKRRWDEVRTPHVEFLGYSAGLVSDV